MNKKIISAILVFAMVLSIGSAFAAELPKVDDIAMVEAVVDMHDLKIMIGDENGNFKGNVAITRAEAATVICRMLGLEDAAKDFAGTASFTDTQNHWAAGYIETVAKLDILAGKDNAVFAPDEQMTFSQLTMALVKALGYEELAKASTLSIADYIAMGEKLGLLDKVELSAEAVMNAADEPALRSYVAMLISAALNVPLAEAKSYNAETGKTEYVILDGQNGTELKTLRKAVFNR